MCIHVACSGRGHGDKVLPPPKVRVHQHGRPPETGAQHLAGQSWTQQRLPLATPPLVTIATSMRSQQPTCTHLGSNYHSPLSCNDHTSNQYTVCSFDGFVTDVCMLWEGDSLSLQWCILECVDEMQQALASFPGLRYSTSNFTGSRGGLGTRLAMMRLRDIQVAR